MVPDKIYLPKEEIEERMPWIATTYDLNWDECYIRKDALLEWAENKIKIPDVSFINGLTYLAYQDVIEHINEM